MKNSLLLYVLTFGFLSISYSQEYGWKDISANIPGTPDLSNVYFVSDNEGWITSSSQPGIYHTTDGGQTFEVQTTQFYTEAIHMLNENEGYAGGGSGYVYRTTDGGENWIAIGSIGVTLTDITFPLTGGTGYACGLNGNIYSVDSSGVERMTSGVNASLYSLNFPINSEEGWICGGSIILTYFNGIWGGLSNSYPSGGYNAIYMVDTLNGWAVGDNGIIIHTTDGQNWFEQTNPDPDGNTFFDVYFLNNNEGWAVGFLHGVLRTTNGGTDWSVEANGLTSNFLLGVHFTSSSNGYVVGAGKTLLRYGEISGIGDEVENIKFEISPNPAQNKIQIHCSEFKTENGIIEILSLDSKKILEKEIETGIENIELDLNNLKSGMYLCKITIDNRSSTKKIIKE